MARKNSTSDELMPREENLPAFLTGGPSAKGTEEIGDSDIIIPRLRLLQQISDEVARGEAEAGTLLNSASNEIYGTEITLLPIYLMKARALFDLENMKGAPICFSSNSRVADPGSKNGGRACVECEFSQWSIDQRTDTRKPPPCNFLYNYPSLVLKDNRLEISAIPIALQLTRSSTPAARSLNTVVKNSNLPFFAHVIRVRTRIRSFRKGDAYIFEVSKIRDANPDEIKIGDKLYDHIVALKPSVAIGGEDAFPEEGSEEGSELPF